VYGVKIREKLVVPYGTEVIDILRKHYSRHRDVEIEYDDLEHIRHLAASAEHTPHRSTTDSIRRVVETEYDDADRIRAAPPPARDYRSHAPLYLRPCFSNAVIIIIFILSPPAQSRRQKN